MCFKTRKELVYLILGAFFITDAVVAELIGGKLFTLGPLTMSIGVIPWPMIFLLTDLINEYYGVEGVRKLTLLTMGMIIYAFIVLYLAMQVPAASFSPVSSEVFANVFGQSLWIIVGSLTAFMCSQFVDVSVFWFFRNRTGMKKLWLRATGSTVVSQIFDTFIVLGIAFWLPGKLTFSEYIKLSLSNYTYKLIIAVCVTPLIYLLHVSIDRFLEDEKHHPAPFT